MIQKTVAKVNINLTIHKKSNTTLLLWIL